MDQLIKATAMDGMIRLVAINSKDLVEEARSLHDTQPTGTALLGRLLTGGLLMASVLKNKEDRLTLQIKGEGPSLGALVTTGGDLKIKGYLGDPTVDVPRKDNGKLDVSGAVGANPMLSVVMDLGLKEPYVSTIPVSSGEVAEDLAEYYVISEQIPTAVALGVLVNPDGFVKESGGLLIQMMPGHDPMLADLITYRLEEMDPLTSQLESGKNITDILNGLFDDMKLDIKEEKTPVYECDCSRERVEKALVSIGLKDLKELYEDGKSEEIVCHFCNKRYTFDQKDIGTLIEEISVN